MKKTHRILTPKSGLIVAELGATLAVLALTAAVVLPNFGRTADLFAQAAGYKHRIDSPETARAAVFGLAAVPIPNISSVDEAFTLAGEKTDDDFEQFAAAAENYLLCSLGRLSLTSCEFVVGPAAPTAAPAAPKPAQTSLIAKPRAAAGAPSTAPAVDPKDAAPSLRSGDLTPAEVRRTVNSYLGRVRFCYAHSPDAKGVVVVKFAVNPDGSASNVAVAESTIDNADIEHCLVRRVSVMRFPQYVGDSKNIIFPFRFGS